MIIDMRTRLAKGPGMQGESSVNGGTLDDATSCAARSQVFGIFGTSIAATWLAGSLDDKVSFFVDEDPSCQGREHLGRPVFAPHQVPHGAQVFLALVPKIAANVATRLTAHGVRFTSPQTLETA